MIRNTQQLIRNGRTPQQRRVRKDACSILEAALRATDPYALVRKHLTVKGNALSVASSLRLDLSTYRHIYLVGAGKAVYKMAFAVEDILRPWITGGCINIPELPSPNQLKKITVCKARHPLPDLQGVVGARRIKRTIERATEHDLIIAVISGGGSALMPLPAEGITLKEKIAVTSLLLKTPATAHEINVIRKHLSGIKGGQFACLAYPATLVTLYISDLIDDPFDLQASGPTAPDPSTFEDAIAILQKYTIWNVVPRNVRRRLMSGAAGVIPETPKPEHEAFCNGKIYNFTIGNHETAVRAAVEAGEKRGYHCLELTSSLQGESREVSRAMIAIGKHIIHYQKPIRKPALVVAGGETTVYVRGKGLGGRNQEFVLAAFPQLQERITLVSFGTDGVDGMTTVPVAGAIADSATRDRALKRKLDVQRFLAQNDSYHFFRALQEHIHTGYTGTNVGDLVLLFVV